MLYHMYYYIKIMMYILIGLIGINCFTIGCSIGFCIGLKLITKELQHSYIYQKSK
jgi:hypothetical protein